MGTVSDEWRPTGVWDAVLIDVLLGLGYDTDAVTKMSAQERIDTVAEARRDGRLDDRTTDMLIRTGVLRGDG